MAHLRFHIQFPSTEFCFNPAFCVYSLVVFQCSLILWSSLVWLSLEMTAWMQGPIFGLSENFVFLSWSLTILNSCIFSPLVKTPQGCQIGHVVLYIGIAAVVNFDLPFLLSSISTQVTSLILILFTSFFFKSSMSKSQSFRNCITGKWTSISVSLIIDS